VKDGNGGKYNWTATDGAKYTLDANYTNLEVYLNSLVENIIAAQGAQ
jgi:hypothetical protein